MYVLISSPDIPELDGLVPGGGHQGGVVGRLDPPAGLHGRLVLGHLHRLVAGQVPALDLLVTARHEHLQQQYAMQG